MIRATIIPVLWLWLACVIIGAAAGTTAHADPAEFYAVGNAATICAVLDAQPTFAGVDELLADIGKTTKLSEAEIGGAVALSVINVCPHHVGLLKRYVVDRGSGAGVV